MHMSTAQIPNNVVPFPEASERGRESFRQAAARVFNSAEMQQLAHQAAPAARRKTDLGAIRRRANLRQGQALEMLGHAVEYLVDSRMFDGGDVRQRDQDEAIQMLMRASRAVFQDCREVEPLGRRLRRWAERFVPVTTGFRLGR